MMFTEWARSGKYWWQSYMKYELRISASKRGQDLKALDVVALAAPYLFRCINYIQERHLALRTQEQLNSLDGKLWTYNLWIFQGLESNKVNMKTKSKVSSLKFIKLRLTASAGKQLVCHSLKEMENNFPTLLRNAILVALGKFFPLDPRLLIYVTTLAKSKYK